MFFEGIVFYVFFEHRIIDFIDKNFFQYLTQNFPKPEFDWDDENLANLQAICPNLFQIFVEDYSPEDEDFDDEDFDDEDEFL